MVDFSEHLDLEEITVWSSDEKQKLVNCRKVEKNVKKYVNKIENKKCLVWNKKLDNF